MANTSTTSAGTGSGADPTTQHDPSVGSDVDPNIDGGAEPEMTDAEYRAYRDEQAALRPRVLGWLLLIAGAVGLIASFALTLERLALFADPDHVPACNLNPILTCSPIMQSDQAALFGFPNPLLGLAAFPVVMAVGALLASRVTLPRWFLGAFWVGTIGGAVFVHWLIYQSLVHLGAMCPYCMVVWFMTVPIFWYTTVYVVQERIIPAPAGVRRFLIHNRGLLLALWYVGLATIALFRFWDFWVTLV